MTHQPPRETVHAFKAFMAMAVKDITEGGEIKPARRIYHFPNRTKTSLAQFKARVIRLRTQR